MYVSVRDRWTAQDQVLAFGTVRSAAHIVFRSTAFGATYGRLAVVPLDRPAGPRAVGPFATAASRGETWLVQGSLAARELRTTRENAECPSVSPDGRRIAYKYRIDNVR
jgi:hypothetical protein